MTRRATMNDLLNALRGMTDAGEDDYSIRGMAYWTDEQLQNALDRYRTDITHEALVAVEETANGAPVYRQYLTFRENWETTAGGTAIFTLQDSSGATVAGTAYSMDYTRGVVEFPATTGGATYYATGRVYNLNAAAAHIWRMKAAHFAGQFTFSTDNMKVEKGELIKNALVMARQYDQMAGPVTMSMVRGDTDG